MKGIVITTKNEIGIHDFTTPLYKSIGQVVGGTIEIVHARGLQHPYCMVVNDEGLLRELPLNSAGSIFYGTSQHGSPIVGDIVLMKEGWTNDGLDFVEFKDGEAEKLMSTIVNRFSPLVDFKMQGGEHNE